MYNNFQYNRQEENIPTESIKTGRLLSTRLTHNGIKACTSKIILDLNGILRQDIPKPNKIRHKVEDRKKADKF